MFGLENVWYSFSVRIIREIKSFLQQELLEELDPYISIEMDQQKKVRCHIILVVYVVFNTLNYHNVH